MFLWGCGRQCRYIDSRVKRYETDSRFNEKRKSVIDDFFSGYLNYFCNIRNYTTGFGLFISERSVILIDCSTDYISAL